MEDQHHQVISWFDTFVLKTEPPNKKGKRFDYQFNINTSSLMVSESTETLHTFVTSSAIIFAAKM